MLFGEHFFYSPLCGEQCSLQLHMVGEAGGRGALLEALLAKVQLAAGSCYSRIEVYDFYRTYF